MLPRASQKGVRFIVRLHKPPLFIDADARQMRQVLLNLFQNALDATPEGGRVWIELQRLIAPPPPITTAPWDTATEISCADTAEMPIFSTANRTNGDRHRIPGTSSECVNDICGSAAGIHILVADSGCGLPSELGDRIFQPFVSTKETGLGLGLSISRRIVQSHGGRIVGSSLATGGSAFSIWLPLREEDWDERSPMSQPEAADLSREYLPVMTQTVR